MKNLSILLHETKLMLKVFIRDRQSFFWAYVFPAGLLILFTSLFSQNNAAIAGGMLVSIIGIAVMAGSLFGIGVAIVTAREAGIYKRYKTTPLSSWIIFASHMLTRTITIFSSIILLILISVIGYGVQLQGNIVSSLLVIIIGIFTFCALGFVIASFAKTMGAALGITNVVFMFMMFIGGIMPPNMMPKFLMKLAMFMPITYFRIALQGAMLDGASIFVFWKDILIMLGFMVIFAAVSIKWFHWERTS
jgi:ABC-2 type transport system permease protein